MAGPHHAAAIVPSGDLDASEAFYRKLGFDVESDYGHYRILADGHGWYLHLTRVEGWPRNVEDNPFGLYLYVDDVDAVADRVRDLIIEEGAPHRKPWGTYEFAVSDPSGTLVRIGRSLDWRSISDGQVATDRDRTARRSGRRAAAAAGGVAGP